MSNVLRSKQGCWTCRLRRKKCDEQHPFCSNCETLKITCYGYGARPEWYDGGDREKAIASSIKQVVKRTSRQRSRLGQSLDRLQGHLRREGSPIKITPSHADLHTGPKPSDESSSPETLIGSGILESSPSSTGPQNEFSESWLSVLKSEEAVLLMHFLDTVFPLQYPLYRPTGPEGGRGWVLSLLLRTKSFYHASLALSAYHREIIFHSISSPCITHTTVDKERHLAICLSQLQQAIKEASRLINTACPTNSLGLMACTIQLVFFELFAGHANAWRIHLNAMTDALRRAYWLQAFEFGLVESPDTQLDGQRTLVMQHGRSPPEESATFTFFCGVTIWLDVLSCITSGLTPRLLTLHPHAINCSSAVKLENIMGCNNWAVMQIASIAALHHDRIQAINQGTTLGAELYRRTEELRLTLRTGLTASSLDSLAISTDNSGASSLSASANTYIITRIFALTASIYFHLVVHGYQFDTYEILTTIAEAMTMLHTKMPVHLMHTVICPLFIIGSVAGEEEKEFFRGVFLSRPVLNPTLEHRSQVLPLLETVWRVKATRLAAWTWQDTVALTDHNLLLH